VPPRYSPTDEPDKLDSEPIEAAARSTPTQAPTAVEDASQEEDRTSRE
jgi:hypothetical protein